MRILREEKPSVVKKKAKKDGISYDVKKWKEKGRNLKIEISPFEKYYFIVDGKVMDSDTNFRKLKRRNRNNRCFFHGTNEENARKILQEGLKKEKIGKSFSISSKDVDGVFLSQTPERCSHWSRSKNVCVYDFDEIKAPVILKIDGVFLDDTKLKDDCFGFPDDKFYEGNIPKEAIKPWSKNPFEDEKIKECRKVFEEVILDKKEVTERDKEKFERKCGMSFEY